MIAAPGSANHAGDQEGQRQPQEDLRAAQDLELFVGVEGFPRERLPVRFRQRLRQHEPAVERPSQSAEGLASAPKTVEVTAKLLRSSSRKRGQKVPRRFARIL